MSESPGARRLVLEDWHRQRGAAFGEVLGVRLPMHYGDAGTELAAAMTAGLIDRSFRDRLEVVGEDRHRFLNGQCTGNVQALLPGQGLYCFFTEARGRILADAAVYALEDRIWLELPPGRGAPLKAHLERYVVADRVELRPLGDFVLLGVVGERALERLAQMMALETAAEGASPWAHGRVTIRGSQLHVARGQIDGPPAATIWVSSGIASEVADDLLAELQLNPVGWQALEAHRVRSGRPRFQLDYGEQNLPQETGVLDAVDFEKGCYLGQEVIARLHYRGQVARLVCLLSAEDEVSVGDEVRHGGRSCGVVTSISGRDGSALAMLHRRAAVESTQVEVATTTARVEKGLEGPGPETAAAEP